MADTKTAAKKAAPAPKTDTVKIGPKDIISLNKKYDGPARREGSKVAKIFDSYKDGITVADFLAASKKDGGCMGNIRRDLEKGRITIKAVAA